MMRVRTVYFKVHDLETVTTWWRRFLGCEPAKRFPEWCEFRVGDINLGLLRLPELSPPVGRPTCIPVLELSDREIAAAIARAKDLGATTILEGEAHPDYPKIAAVLADPFGNEFGLTSYQE